MAYAALVSLHQILDQLLNTDPFPINYPESQIKSLRVNISYLKDFLESILPGSKINKSAVTDLETQIRDSVYEAEDTVERYICSRVSLDLNKKLDELIQAIRSIVEKIYDLRQGTRSLSDAAAVEFKDERKGGSLPSVEAKNKIVGFENDIEQLVDSLTGPHSKLEIVSIVGMTGIGKTTLAEKVYHHRFISYHFERRAFVTISPRYGVQEILREILVLTQERVDVWHEKTDYSVHELVVYRSLMDVRYLIVLDGILDIRIWDELKRIFPDNRTGSRILITTTLVTELAAYVGGYIHHISFMNAAESWDLLREVVFAEESCPQELEKIGKKIAQNCQGLPLEIISVGRRLAKAERTLECWKKVEENQMSVPTWEDDKDKFDKLYLSYENLPQYLKACFLYMGVFPQNYEIPASKLIRLLVAEGFLEPKIHKSLEDVAEECLNRLVDRCLVILHGQSSRGKIKTCRVHHLFRRLCVTEAKKDKFFHVINGYTVNGFPEGLAVQRRLCIHKNVVLGIKDMHELMASVSNARSLLCIAAHHQYPLPVCLQFKLLKVLDALTIRFYNFPAPILKLARLRYLALTFNGLLPTSISVLRSLRILILRPYLRIKSSESTLSYLPMEIWNMKELRHLQCMGSDLPNPCGAEQLPNLLTLSDVSPSSCTERVLKRIGRLKKLGIRIELVPSDQAPEPLSPFGHLTLLDQLESLKCVVVNPKFGSQIIKLQDSISIFPVRLEKITLSGCGFSWKDMKIISGLPNLIVLKLRELAFQGPEWELLEGEFLHLRFLLLESMDLVHWNLVHWKADWSHFPALHSLILKHCYQLERVPSEIGEIRTLKLIQLVDCSPSAMDSAREIEQEQQESGNYDLKVSISSAPE